MLLQSGHGHWSQPQPVHASRIMQRLYRGQNLNIASNQLMRAGPLSLQRFATRSGVLTVSARGDGSLAMDFPAWPPAQIDPPARIADALGTPVEWTGRSGNDYLLALVADERAVRDVLSDSSRLGSPRWEESKLDSMSLG